MRRRGNALEAETGNEVDMTPMLDIVFIMLIFFVVTASFVQESGIDVNRPKAENSQNKEDASLLIGINEANEIWMSGKRVELQKVKALVEQKRAEQPNASAVVQSDGAADVSVLASVIDAVKSGGISDVALATEK